MLKPRILVTGDKAGKFDQVEDALEAMFGLDYKGTLPYIKKFRYLSFSSFKGTC